MNWSALALFIIGAVSTGLYLLSHFKELDDWWHRFIFNQFEKHYLYDKLQVGGHCGCCGAWVPDKILPKYWAITLCEECLSPTPSKTEEKEG